MIPFSKQITAIFFSIFVLIVADIVLDLLFPGLVWHIICEGCAGVLSAGAFVWVLREWVSTQSLLVDTNASLVQAKMNWKMETESLRGELLRSIDHQLEVWGLSQAEKEVALHILKGLSLKEIAKQRFTQEKTARVQATAIYSKSGLSGRHELMAFFLDSLFTPMKTLSNVGSRQQKSVI